MTLTRKRRKPRAKGTGCQAYKCRALMVMVVDDVRYCTKHAADRLTGNAVRERDGGLCRRCGAFPPEEGVNDWGHVMPRNLRSIRWDLGNAVTLCRGCHTYFGFAGRRLEWEQWCRDQGIDWDGLRWRAFNEPAENPEAVVERLRGASIGETPA